jgi:hypothetical protein
MAAKWFIEKNGKFYGPFEAQKVLAYHRAGKIDDDTAVAQSRDGKAAQPFTTVVDELNAPAVVEAEVVEKPKPVPRPQKPAPRARKPQTEAIEKRKKKQRLQRRHFLMIAAGLLIGVIGGAVYLVLELQDSKTFEKLRMSILEESAPLRSQAIQTDIPNFNALVLPAIRKLYLPQRQIAQHYARAVIAYDSDSGSKHFGHLYSGIVRRETQYLTNGQITYTYIYDEGLAAVAVAVRGPNFHRLRRSQMSHEDFSSKPVRELARGERVIWSSDVTADVRVEAHWKLDGASHVLDYVAIVPIETFGDL